MKALLPLTYLWNFGDGSPVTTTVNTTYVYTHSGVFTVKMTVKRMWGPESTDLVPITIKSHTTYLPIITRN